MRFIDELGLLLVVDGTHILRIYASGPRQVARIEPATEMHMINAKNKFSSRNRALKGKAHNNVVGLRIESSSTAANTQEVLYTVKSDIRPVTTA